MGEIFVTFIELGRIWGTYLLLLLNLTGKTAIFLALKGNNSYKTFKMYNFRIKLERYKCFGIIKAELKKN